MSTNRRPAGMVARRVRTSAGTFAPGWVAPSAGAQLRALGDAIYRRRALRGLTQVTLADRAGIGRQQVNRLERGHWAPRLDTLWRIAGALETCPSALLGDAEDALDG
jgi:DNA-binding XRE family transcriptional regulator